MLITCYLINYFYALNSCQSLLYYYYSKSNFSRILKLYIKYEIKQIILQTEITRQQNLNIIHSYYIISLRKFNKNELPILILFAHMKYTLLTAVCF